MSYERNSVTSITSNHTASSRNQSKDHTSFSVARRLARRLPENAIVPISGGLAGAIAGIVCCPLDVIKTKLQAQGGFHPRRIPGAAVSNSYKGIAGSAATIWREDGIRGMYRGLGPMMLGYIPTWAVYLTVYNSSQAFFRLRTDNWFLANVYASVCAGACSTLATNPIWVIKTRFMSQSGKSPDPLQAKAPWHYRNTWDAARKIYGTEGFLAFYSGLTPALLGLAHVAIQFPLYEVLKEKFTGLGRGQKESAEERGHHFYGLAMAIFLSKVCASTATYPHEVVRTRLQTQQRRIVNPGAIDSKPDAARQPAVNGLSKLSSGPATMTSVIKNKTTWETCRTIYLEEGWRGFYAGLGTNLLRAVPSAMTTILSFEILKKSFDDLRRDQDDDGEP